VLVDDEAPVRHAVERLMAFEPVELVSAGTGAEALARLAEDLTAVMITDYHLDDLDGVELLRRAREISPDTSRILFSGHVDVELIRSAVNAGEVYRFIAKPWNDDELIMAVRHGIERWQLMRRNRELLRETAEQNRRLSNFADELEEQVQTRTEALALRNRALSLSQDVLDRLPVAVIGIAPDGAVALINELGRRIFPDLAPGDRADRVLPLPVRAWLHTPMMDPHPCDLDSAFGRLRYEHLDLGERGVVVTAMPLGMAGEPGNRL
jgi:FixJ family two-component response regulator